MRRCCHPLGLAIALFVSAAIRWSPALAQDADCRKCHADATREKVVHAPLHKGCRTCHEGLDAAAVPHKGPKVDVPALCARCHAARDFRGKFTHAPVAADKCTLCHAPHSSAYAGLLVQSAAALCLSCHAEVAKRPHLIAGFSTQGHPLGHEKRAQPAMDPLRPGQPFSCTSCHEPHRSEFARLVRFESRSMTDTCQRCHRL